MSWRNMNPCKEKQKQNPVDMKYLRSTKGETRKGRIRNGIFREELGIQNLLIDLEEN
jgi:hypothetical protein